MLRAHTFLLAGPLLIAACGASPLSSVADGAAGADGQAPGGDVAVETTPEAAPETVPGCPPGLASGDELASTPRTDVNLELLALKLSPGKLVAPQAAYDRVVRDVGAMRTMQPELAKIGFFSFRDGRSIDLVVAVETGRQMEMGTYHAWDCLNQTYGAVLPAEYHGIGQGEDAFVFFKLRGIYATELLETEYARLPGVTNAGSIALGGDGPTICASADGTTWHYVFDDASGDCPAGCIDHAYRHFATDPAGTVTELGTWTTKDGTPRPAWVTQLASPDRCH